MRIKFATRLSAVVGAAALLGAGTIIGSAGVKAATDTDTFTVTAAVADICNITATTNMDFGLYDPTAPGDNDAGTSTITMVCTPTTPYDIALDEGSSPNPGRDLTDGTDSLTYELYSDLGRTTVWDDTGSTVSGVAPAGPQVFTVYGRIFQGQAVPPSLAYNDLVTVTVTY